MFSPCSPVLPVCKGTQAGFFVRIGLGGGIRNFLYLLFFFWDDSSVYLFGTRASGSQSYYEIAQSYH